MIETSRVEPTMNRANMIYADKHLSQKLERTEALSNVAFAESMAKIFPNAGACFIEVAGTYAMYEGVGSLFNQTFGLGLFGEISEKELAEIENFFIQRKSTVCHEVSPLADASLMPLLNKRGYQPIELTSVMFRPIDGKIQADVGKGPHLKTRIIGPSEAEIWARTSAQGWATESQSISEYLLKFGVSSAHCTGGFAYIAELDGTPISTAMLFIVDDVALLAGASTIPQGRGQGAQAALLEARLQCAKSWGCKIAMMCAAPGSQSQCNGEKHGFGVTYTRTKWEKTYDKSVRP